MTHADGLIRWSELMTLGAQELEDNKLDTALKAFGRAVAIGRKMGQLELLSFSLRMQGIVYNRLGNYTEARIAFSESLELARTTDNIRGQAEAISGLANVAFAMDEIEISEDLFAEACEKFDQINEQLRKAMVLCDLGALQSNNGDWNKAYGSYHQALHLCRSHREKYGEAEILVMLGELSRRQGDLEQAVINLKAASMVFAALEDWRNLAATLQYLGLNYHELGDLERSADSHRRALALWSQLGENEEMALVQFALGKVYQAMGQVTEAEDCFLKSLEMLKNDPEGAGHRQQNLGNLYLMKKDWFKAEEYFKAAAESFELAGKTGKTGELLEVLGFLQEVQGITNLAEEYYTRALRAFEAGGQKRGQGDVYRSLGLMYNCDGKSKKALEYLWKALRIYRELDETEVVKLEGEIQKISRRIRRGN
ncbi:MAG TPA: tetratricopeptide repeat protein [Verrucomicrobiae bacterium]|nr:tetratricopeptide repeat protein [Verrucomicrobiae bacterium]